MKSILAVTAAVFIGLAGWLAFYLGLHKPVSLDRREVGPLRLLYKEHSGPYYKIASVIEEVELWARANGEPCEVSYGEYLDDPHIVEEDRLRSRGGCVVASTLTELPPGFAYEEKPNRLYVTALFGGAPSAGPMKVYPKAQDWIRENGLVTDGPVIELYRIQDDQTVQTEYLFPVKTTP